MGLFLIYIPCPWIQMNVRFTPSPPAYNPFLQLIFFSSFFYLFCCFRFIALIKINSYIFFSMKIHLLTLVCRRIYTYMPFLFTPLYIYSRVIFIFNTGPNMLYDYTEKLREPEKYDVMANKLLFNSKSLYMKNTFNLFGFFFWRGRGGKIFTKKSIGNSNYVQFSISWYLRER